MAALFRKKKPPASGPDWWQAYQALDWNYPARKTSIEELRLVVLDTEATGMDPQKDRMLSVSAVRVARREVYVGDTLELLVAQPDFVRNESIQIHGILPGESKETGEAEAEVIRQVVEFLGNRVIVGHHIGFDIRLINEGLARLGLGTLKNRWLDTKQLAIKVEHLFPNPYLRGEDYTLDALCNRYNVRPRYRHTASGDTFITAVLLLKLLAKLEKRGLTTWKEIR